MKILINLEYIYLTMVYPTETTGACGLYELNLFMIIDRQKLTGVYYYYESIIWREDSFVMEY